MCIATESFLARFLFDAFLALEHALERHAQCSFSRGIAGQCGDKTVVLGISLWLRIMFTRQFSQHGVSVVSHARNLGMDY